MSVVSPPGQEQIGKVSLGGCRADAHPMPGVSPFGQSPFVPAGHVTATARQPASGLCCHADGSVCA